MTRSELDRLAQNYERENYRNALYEFTEISRVKRDFEAGFHAALESQIVRRLVDALKCNETFHRLGGIDDCDPCKALAAFTKAKEGLK